MDISEAPLQLFLNKLRLRSTINADEGRAILSLLGQAVRIPANRAFVRLGERVDHANLVVEGLVGRFAETREGGRQIMAFHLPGDMANLNSIVAPAAGAALEALAATTILRVPHASLRELTRHHPGIAEAFWLESVVDAAILEAWIVNLGRRDAMTRTAHLICEIACRTGGARDGHSFHFPATQLHLADMLGLTAVHVNRMLANLRTNGFIRVSGRRFEILRWQALAKLGEFDPAYLRVGRAANDDDTCKVA